MKPIVDHLLKGIVGVCLMAMATTTMAAVNVNTADEKAIAKELDGVGDKMASAIVKERAKAPFTSLEDLDKRIKGWGKKTSEHNKDKVKFSDK